MKEVAVRDNEESLAKRMDAYEKRMDAIEKNVAAILESIRERSLEIKQIRQSQKDESGSTRLTPLTTQQHEDNQIQEIQAIVVFNDVHKMTKDLDISLDKYVKHVVIEASCESQASKSCEKGSRKTNATLTTSLVNYEENQLHVKEKKSIGDTSWICLCYRKEAVLQFTRINQVWDPGGEWLEKCCRRSSGSFTH